MKQSMFTIVIGLMCAAALAYSPMPAWDRVEGKSVSFFMSKGFGFEVDASMGHHYDKPTVEISLIAPLQFTNDKVEYEFSSVLFLSKEFSADLDSHPHEKKKRTILTISEEMARKSQIVFYFKNESKTATDGTMFILDLSKVLDHWKNEKKPNQAIDSDKK